MKPYIAPLSRMLPPVLLATLLGACVHGDNVERLHAGMSRDQVQAVLGPSESSAYSPGKECSYYTVLNAGILALAWMRPWRILNLLGFGFTWGIATAWGVLDYAPEKFASTEPFLLLFFAFYLAIEREFCESF